LKCAIAIAESDSSGLIDWPSGQISMSAGGARSEAIADLLLHEASREP
jgi:hypothetical protein